MARELLALWLSQSVVRLEAQAHGLSSGKWMKALQHRQQESERKSYDKVLSKLEQQIVTGMLPRARNPNPSVGPSTPRNKKGKDGMIFGGLRAPRSSSQLCNYSHV